MPWVLEDLSILGKYQQIWNEKETIQKDFKKTSRQKISKELLDLNYTLDQMYLRDINSTVHFTAAEYIYSQVHTEYSPR